MYSNHSFSWIVISLGNPDRKVQVQGFTSRHLEKNIPICEYNVSLQFPCLKNVYWCVLKFRVISFHNWRSRFCQSPSLTPFIPNTLALMKSLRSVPIMTPRTDQMSLLVELSMRFSDSISDFPTGRIKHQLRWFKFYITVMAVSLLWELVVVFSWKVLFTLTSPRPDRISLQVELRIRSTDSSSDFPTGVNKHQVIWFKFWFPLCPHTPALLDHHGRRRVGRNLRSRLDSGFRYDLVLQYFVPSILDCYRDQKHSILYGFGCKRWDRKSLCLPSLWLFAYAVPMTFRLTAKLIDCPVPHR